MSSDAAALVAGRVSRPADDVDDAWLAAAYRGDPLAAQAARVRHPAGTLGLAWLALIVVSDLALTTLRGTFFSHVGFIGWWFDLTTILQEIFAFPLLAFFYMWTPRALLAALRSLRDQGLLEIRSEDEDWLASAVDGQRWAGKQAPPWLAPSILLAAAGVGATLYWTYTTSLNGRLWLADPPVTAVKAVFWTLNAYMGAWLVVRMVILINFLSRVFSNGRKITVEPLHPDGCGGLAALATFSLRLTAFIGFVGATFLLIERNYFFAHGLQLTWQALPIHAMAIFAMTMSTVVFWAPLAAPHRVMADAKRERLAHLSAQFRRVEEGIDPNQLESLLGAAPKLQAVRAVYGEVAKFPVWPFDTRILRFFTAAVLGQPALAVAVDLFKDQLKALLQVILGG